MFFCVVLRVLWCYLLLPVMFICVVLRVLWGIIPLKQAFQVCLSTSHKVSCKISFLTPNEMCFLGGLSVHLNHLILSRLAISFRQFGTLPIAIFLSNLVSRQLETSPRAPLGPPELIDD